MPSPVGHGLAGLIVHVLASRDQHELTDRWRLGVTLGAALIPDVDLLFRFVDGRNHHDNETHSLGFALLAAASAALAFRLLGWVRPVALALAVGAAWSSHVLLDYLNVDTNPPIGIMALWPLSQGYFKVPWPIFLDIGRTLEWATVRHNILAAAWEAVVLSPLLAAAWRFRSRRMG
ncbi:MAG TPA: metal-dependent hydrolase [Vicinamibacteria bacterium]|nr:metal-dependent hydrolase [Vicinamibacteria bacterium]